MILERNGLRSHSQNIDSGNGEHHNDERVRWGEFAHRALALLSLLLTAIVVNEAIYNHEQILEGRVTWLPQTFVDNYAGPFAVFCGIEDEPGTFEVADYNTTFENATDAGLQQVEDELNSRMLIYLKLFTTVSEQIVKCVGYT